ncbi:uncharacterized protein HMPREF1541_07336 [Cyphellophora europaea CBS 101466]|uniref:Glucose-methanol-choline oxidoreductase C-terminal domain-containing protein n=1 Tax=Cyphellophora europaea (strain CBS 101466) TaxID=1220924 RepID=W2RPT0_CYPE1|nr:uncharacterized protein HMPREF1541_07336 [Cyphellophora europaea CBS 101466]ETN37713.1 hypothetical protein HMPREF1541_07336 [Cyphellophora europaea CBS 101466]
MGAPGGLLRGLEPGSSSPPPSPNCWSWIMVKVQPPGDPSSTGNMTLRSTDPRAVPSIDFNWLRGEEDERATCRALTQAPDLLMRGFKRAPEEYQPFVRHQPPDDISPRQGSRDEALGHHASCTCRMGPDEGDHKACVDSRLRVRGSKNLRVADALVSPYTPGAFPALSVYSIRIKAADIA